MPSKSKVGFDFKLNKGTVTQLTTTYAEICKLRMGRLPPMEREIVRVDELHDEWKKILAGKKKLGDLNFEALLTEDNYETVLALFDETPGADPILLEIEFPTESGETTPFKVRFSGICKMIDGTELNAESTTAATIPFTFEGSGELTTVPST